jgi:hypothetical protein
VSAVGCRAGASARPEAHFGCAAVAALRSPCRRTRAWCVGGVHAMGAGSHVSVGTFMTLSHAGPHNSMATQQFCHTHVCARRAFDRLCSRSPVSYCAAVNRLSSQPSMSASFSSPSCSGQRSSGAAAAPREAR